MKQSYRYLLGLFILLAVLLLIEKYIGWQKLLAPWQSLSLGAASLAITLTLISYLFRAWRYYDYFRNEMHGAFALCFKLMLHHNMLNNLLPMRSGEISFPLLMARYFQVPAVRSVPALLWFRVLDLHTIVLLALAAAPLWSNQHALIAIGLLFWLCLPWLGFSFGARALPSLSDATHSKPRRLLAQFRQGLPIDANAFWRSWAMTVANWLVKLIGFAWVLSLFSGAPPFAVWMGAIGGDVSSVLPFHGIAGVGTFEAGVVAAMAPLGVPLSTATAAAVNLHLFVLGTSVVGGMLALVIVKSRPNG